MLVQTYLKENGIQRLRDEYSIQISEYDDRIILNYSQTDSPRNHPVCDECRGLILSLPDYEIMARPFERFYNFGEAGTDNFDFTKCDIYTKEDGSIVCLYYDKFKDTWRFSTRKKAFAEGTTAYGNSFQELILHAGGWESLEAMQNEMKDRLSLWEGEDSVKNKTFVLELVGPRNRVVTPYAEDKLILLAVIDNSSGRTYPDYAKERFNAAFPQVPIVNKFTTQQDISTDYIDKLMAEMTKKVPLFEGFVVHNPVTDARIKIKSKAYLTARYMRMNGTVTEKRVIEFILENEYHEYLIYYPEDKPLFDKYVEAMDSLIQRVNKTFSTLYHRTKDRKEFAGMAKAYSFSPLLFSMLKWEEETETLFYKLSTSLKVKLISEEANK